MWLFYQSQSSMIVHLNANKWSIPGWCEVVSMERGLRQYLQAGFGIAGISSQWKIQWNMPHIDPCFWTGDRLGYESRGACCGQKRSRKMGKWLEFGGGSAIAWDLGCFPLHPSLEIFTSRSSELCFSEFVGLNVGSAPGPVDCDRHRIVELLSRSDHSVRRHRAKC